MQLPDPLQQHHLWREIKTNIRERLRKQRTVRGSPSHLPLTCCSSLQYWSIAGLGPLLASTHSLSSILAGDTETFALVPQLLFVLNRFAWLPPFLDRVLLFLNICCTAEIGCIFYRVICTIYMVTKFLTSAETFGIDLYQGRKSPLNRISSFLFPRISPLL